MSDIKGRFIHHVLAGKGGPSPVRFIVKCDTPKHQKGKSRERQSSNR